MNLAVIDAPSGPPGWEESRTHLIRIVDPSGRAVAWFAPEYGAMCAGFAMRVSGQRGMKWTQMFHAIEPPSPAPKPLKALLPLPASGCIVRCVLRADFPLPMQSWQYVARDPTAVVMETAISTNGDDCRCDDRDSSLHLRLTARLDDAALMLDLEADNTGTRVISPHLAFHVSFARRFTESTGASLQLVTTTTTTATMGEYAQKLVTSPDIASGEYVSALPTDTVLLEPDGRVRIGIVFRAMVNDDDLRNVMHR